MIAFLRALILAGMGIALLVTNSTATAGTDRAQDLCVAAQKGDISEVADILAKGADVNARDRFGRTPLHWAAYQGRTEVMKLLLARGADINSQRMEQDNVSGIPTSQGPIGTPLYSAILAGQLQAAKVLILKDANVNVKIEGGSTPLFLMCRLTGSLKPNPSPRSVRRSIPKKDFPFSARPRQGFNCDASAAEVTALLLAKGADINIRDGYDRSPLMKACRYGCLEIVKLLVAQGAEVNGQDKFGMTALDLACSEANSEIVTFLLENGANVETERDTEGHVLLHMGTWVFCPQVTKAVLAKHVGSETDFGTVLHFASFVGQTETVRLLLEHGVNINARDKTGFQTLLRDAYRKSSLDLGTSVGESGDISGIVFVPTPSRVAYDMNGTRNNWIYQRGRRHWFFELIDYSGSDRAPCTGVSDVQTSGATALHWASLGGQPEVIRLLLANGADPKAVDDDGHSALHVACAIHDPEVAKLLIDNGANVNQKDRKERTPLAWALKTAGRAPIWSTPGGAYSTDSEVIIGDEKWQDAFCNFSESNYKKLIKLLEAAGAEK